MDSSRCSVPHEDSFVTGGSMTTSHRSYVMFSTGCQSHSASSTSSVTSQSCSRVPARLLHWDSFLHVRAKTTIPGEDCSPCTEDGRTSAIVHSLLPVLNAGTVSLLLSTWLTQ